MMTKENAKRIKEASIDYVTTLRPKKFKTRKETEAEIERLLKLLDNYKGDKLDFYEKKIAGNLIAKVMYYINILNDENKERKEKKTRSKK